MEFAILDLPERKSPMRETCCTSLYLLTQLEYDRNAREDVEERQESLADCIRLRWRGATGMLSHEMGKSLDHHPKSGIKP